MCPQLIHVQGSIVANPKHDFWERVFDNVFDNGPQIENIDEAFKLKKGSLKGSFREALESRATISEDALSELKIKHAAFVAGIPDKLQNAYRKGTTGIVLVGGTKYSWLGYLAILSLRNTGCTLPVEVIIPTFAEYEQEMKFCHKVLPGLNASCVILPDKLGPNVMMKYSFKSYQFKGLAMLASSFESVLMLDSDNLMVQDPSPVFHSDLYKTKGMILWPDYWERTMSPEIYKLLDLDVDETKRVRLQRFPFVLSEDSPQAQPEEMKKVPYSDLSGTLENLSTESGQMIINKGTHFQTLLLSLYYNVYGPKLYYRLTSLGGAGEGDKETFPLAAFALGQPFYQVKTMMKTIGFYKDNGGGFRGVGMAQRNPLEDYQLYKEHFEVPQGEGDWDHLTIEEQTQKINKVKNKVFGGGGPASVWTMHCNFPKLDPAGLYGGEFYDKDKKRLKYRIFGKTIPEFPNNKKYDFELVQWTNIKKSLCEDKIEFSYFKKKDVDLCEFINNQVAWLTETTLVPPEDILSDSDDSESQTSTDKEKEHKSLNANESKNQAKENESDSNKNE
ncbi:uncharacterized protein KQ657_001577 [Scheffersomyces spartinae]|uniref:Alpha-1,2-mannosyltransferase n=1 Tax=Scheffersomyces spartinae TaxID=45513 RepID=A0A9P8AHH2_9ASCO|nr:uncharacterized protein KQ657_001577 [Scheffersomyces spartinae]KAG7192791.1 hypothetical protein KQ657_001577 [Scheffersomyces spartinae]